ncbi:MAG: NUDIX domain-containing protein [Deltaproteobacteria bacterium]|nr:NUDIX domain-containing protein [Deltaproteobacteria bacterium]
MSSPSPLDSATVIVMREAAGAFEVLLVERHANSRAFAGAHVFPGGVVDPADATARLHEASPRLTPAAAARRLGEETTPAAALAFWIAAIRELFEEAGLLLARIAGVPLTFDDTTTRARFREHRAAILAGATTFADVVATEQLELATDALHYFSRWITPVIAPRRYDARFFVAGVPTGQEPLHDDRETISIAWRSPRAALASARAGKMVLTPPTVRTLDDLDALGTPARVVTAADARRVTAILPKPVQVDGCMAILYPGDAEYDAALPGTSLVDAGVGRRNRAIMQDGGWRSIRTPD